MSRRSLYIGRSGQLAVMAEFLFRGYNVAIPEVDVGDDIFVVKDSNGEYARVQVKTAVATKTNTGYSARYALKFAQLETNTVPETWYVFANRLDTGWQSFVIIARQTLYNLHDVYSIGFLNQRNVLSLHFSYTDNTVTCRDQDLSFYLNNWQEWPLITHQ
jgi:hypothetical protein